MPSRPNHAGPVRTVASPLTHSGPTPRRIQNRHRYRVTDMGLRVALFVPRLWARTLRPGLATVMPDAAPNDSALRRAFERLETAMDDRSHTMHVVIADLHEDRPRHRQQIPPRAR